MNNILPNLNEAPGNTPLTAEEQAKLIPSLATKAELNEWERQNILEAYSWAMNPPVLAREDPLTEPYVRELHKRMFDQTWKWAGNYRTIERLNLGVPFHEIRNRIPAILADARYQLENKCFGVDEIAIRFHHRLVWIHAFPNGNGRHARLLADVIAAKNGREPFTWGREQLHDGAVRGEYIRLLQAADRDNEDIQGLLKFARS